MIEEIKTLDEPNDSETKPNAESLDVPLTKAETHESPLPEVEIPEPSPTVEVPIAPGRVRDCYAI